jgi:2-iminobutanoate/2-iminopropanoate deaminase
MAATIQKYGAPGVYDPPGYSQAIKVTGAQTILFLAGQVPYAPDGTVNHRGDFTTQARQVFSAVKSLVEAGGGTLANVVKITTYVTDVRDRMDFRGVRDEFFGQRGPASTMVQVASLSHPDYMNRGAGRDLVTWGPRHGPPHPPTFGAPRRSRVAPLGRARAARQRTPKPRAMNAATNTITSTSAISAWVTA